MNSKKAIACDIGEANIEIKLSNDIKISLLKIFMPLDMNAPKLAQKKEIRIEATWHKIVFRKTITAKVITPTRT